MNIAQFVSDYHSTVNAIIDKINGGYVLRSNHTYAYRNDNNLNRVVTFTIYGFSIHIDYRDYDNPDNDFTYVLEYGPYKDFRLSRHFFNRIVEEINEQFRNYYRVYYKWRGSAPVFGYDTFDCPNKAMAIRRLENHLIHTLGNSRYSVEEGLMIVRVV